MVIQSLLQNKIHLIITPSIIKELQLAFIFNNQTINNFMIMQAQRHIHQKLNTISQKINIQILIQPKLYTNNTSDFQNLFNQFLLQIGNSSGTLVQPSLKLLETLIKKGYSTVLLKKQDLLKKLMMQFVCLSRQLQVYLSLMENPQSNANIEFRMIYLLSLIAQIIRQNPKFYFPFSKRFLIAAFQIDYDLLNQSRHKNDILAMLSVIFQNFSKQGRLIKRYKMLEKLTQAVLINYSLIQQLFTLKQSNKVIVNLVKIGVKFQTNEFKKYQIFQTMQQFVQDKQIKLNALRLRGVRNCNRHLTGKFD